MTDQEKHFEENKEHSSISEDGFTSASIQNHPTKIGFTSILLSAAFYLSIIYLVLFISYFALSGNAWGLFILIFLGPNFLGVAIGAILLRLGMKRRNKNLLYTSFVLYLLSIILGIDLDLEFFRIAQLLLVILVLIGNLLVEDENSY